MAGARRSRRAAGTEMCADIRRHARSDLTMRGRRAQDRPSRSSTARPPRVPERSASAEPSASGEPEHDDRDARERDAPESRRAARGSPRSGSPRCARPRSGWWCGLGGDPLGQRDPHRRGSRPPPPAALVYVVYHRDLPRATTRGKGSALAYVAMLANGSGLLSTGGSTPAFLAVIPVFAYAFSIGSSTRSVIIATTICVAMHMGLGVAHWPGAIRAASPWWAAAPGFCGPRNWSR